MVATIFAWAVLSIIGILSVVGILKASEKEGCGEALTLLVVSAAAYGGIFWAAWVLVGK